MEIINHIIGGGEDGLVVYDIAEGVDNLDFNTSNSSGKVSKDSEGIKLSANQTSYVFFNVTNEVDISNIPNPYLELTFKWGSTIKANHTYLASNQTTSETRTNTCAIQMDMYHYSSCYKDMEAVCSTMLHNKNQLKFAIGLSSYTAGSQAYMYLKKAVVRSMHD